MAVRHVHTHLERNKHLTGVARADAVLRNVHAGARLEKIERRLHHTDVRL